MNYLYNSNKDIFKREIWCRQLNRMVFVEFTNNTIGLTLFIKIYSDDIIAKNECIRLNTLYQKHFS